MNIDQYRPSYAPLSLASNPNASCSVAVTNNTSVHWSDLSKWPGNVEAVAATNELMSLNLSVVADNTLLRKVVKTFPDSKVRRPMLTTMSSVGEQGMGLLAVSIGHIASANPDGLYNSETAVSPVHNIDVKGQDIDEDLVWTRFNGLDSNWIGAQLLIDLPKILEVADGSDGEFDVNVASLLSSGLAAGIRQIAEHRIPKNTSHYQLTQGVALEAVPFVTGGYFMREAFERDVVGGIGALTFFAASTIIGTRTLRKMESTDGVRISPREYLGSHKQFTEKLDQALSVPSVVPSSVA